MTMANLWKGTIENKDTWRKFTTISGVSLTDGTKYSIQILGACWLCESATEPSDNDGFLIKNDPRPFGFVKKSGADLYVRANSEYCTLNIAE